MERMLRNFYYDMVGWSFADVVSTNLIFLSQVCLAFDFSCDHIARRIPTNIFF
jgi:hypothetical protein